MRPFFVLLMLFVSPALWAAGQCSLEARTLADELAVEFPDAFAGDLAKVEAVILKHCEQRVTKELAEKKDAFTELFLSNDTGNKPGNKRLKRKSP